MKSPDPIRGARRAPLWCWPVLAVVLVAGMLFLNRVFLPGRSWRALWEVSGGWVHPTLLGGWMVLALVLLVLVAGAKLRPGELGLQARRVPVAVLYALLLWTAVQGIFLGYGMALGDRPPLHGQWSDPGIPGGSLLGQLFGNALLEEVVYRGFLFTQLVLLFGGKGEVSRPRLLGLALAAGAVFALAHVPNRQMKGLYDAPLEVLLDQGVLIVSGVLLALVYWRTRNLPFAIALHALSNRPTSLFDTPADTLLPPEAALFLGGLALAVAWPRLPFTGSSRT